MKTMQFIEMCKREFAFLENVFGFKMIEQDVCDVGVEIVFKNDTTGVRIWYEFREFFVFVYICQLVDGDLVLPSGEMCPDTKLYCYDLGDLVAIRSPESAIAPYQSGTLLNTEALHAIICRQADNLTNYAKDILLGDFAIFSKLNEIVKARAREAALQKWGDQAHIYGW